MAQEAAIAGESLMFMKLSYSLGVNLPTSTSFLH
jgi:hypothetical protein